MSQADLRKQRGIEKSIATRTRMLEEEIREEQEHPERLPTTRVCASCQERKSIAEDFYPAKKTLKCGLTRTYTDAYCKACRRQRALERYKRKKAEGFDWNQYGREHGDPEKRRARARAGAAAARRRKGSPVGTLRVPAKNKRDLVPSGPLKEFLAKRLGFEKRREIAEDNPSLERRIYDVMNANGTIESRVADEILTGLEHPEMLNLLYPLK